MAVLPLQDQSRARLAEIPFNPGGPCGKKWWVVGSHSPRQDRAKSKWWSSNLRVISIKNEQDFHLEKELYDDSQPKNTWFHPRRSWHHNVLPVASGSPSWMWNRAMWNRWQGSLESLLRVKLLWVPCSGRWIPIWGCGISRKKNRENIIFLCLEIAELAPERLHRYFNGENSPVYKKSSSNLPMKHVQKCGTLVFKDLDFTGKHGD